MKDRVYWLQLGSTFTHLSITSKHCELHIVFKNYIHSADIPQVIKLLHYLCQLCILE